MMEVADETRYVPHHPKKLVLVLSAMRHFAAQLREDGFRVEYVKLDSSRSRESFTATLKHFLERKNFDRLIVTEAGEYRVQQMLESWTDALGLPVEILTDDRFPRQPRRLCSLGKGSPFTAAGNLLSAHA